MLEARDCMGRPEKVSAGTSRMASNASASSLMSKGAAHARMVSIISASMMTFSASVISNAARLRNVQL